MADEIGMRKLADVVRISQATPQTPKTLLAQLQSSADQIERLVVMVEWRDPEADPGQVTEDSRTSVFWTSSELRDLWWTAYTGYMGIRDFLFGDNNIEGE